MNNSILKNIKNLPSDIQIIIYQYDDTYKYYYTETLKALIKNTNRWRTNFKLLPYESNRYVYREYKAGYKETFHAIKKRCDVLNDQEVQLRKKYNCKFWTYSYYYPIYEFFPIPDIKYEHENTYAIPPPSPFNRYNQPPPQQ